MDDHAAPLRFYSWPQGRRRLDRFAQIEFDLEQADNLRYAVVREGKALDGYRDYFNDKLILVTGGTGSFGHQVVSTLLQFDPGKIIVFSRDEKKQVDMQRAYDNSPRLEFVIGDVRDYNSVLA